MVHTVLAKSSLDKPISFCIYSILKQNKKYLVQISRFIHKNQEKFKRIILKKFSSCYINFYAFIICKFKNINKFFLYKYEKLSAKTNWFHDLLI